MVHHRPEVSDLILSLLFLENLTNKTGKAVTQTYIILYILLVYIYIDLTYFGSCFGYETGHIRNKAFELRVRGRERAICQSNINRNYKTAYFFDGFSF